jgi:hypothetical protein
MASVCPEPPEDLRGYALAQWHKVAPDLFAMQLLSHVDTEAPAMYCQSFLWLICGSGWLGYATEGTDEHAGILALLAFGWPFVANALMNALVRRRAGRFGPIDLSKNTSTTGIKRLLSGLFLAAALAAGVVTAALSVQGIARLELKILICFIIFLVVTGLTHGALTLAVILLSGFWIRPVLG